MPAEDDILLLQLIKQDDEKAFKHLFDTYFVSLCRFMSLYLRDKQEIEELALSIFMNLWEGRADLTLKISFKAYLFQSARNRCLNALRDEKDTVPIEGGEEYGYALAADTSVEMEELNRLIEDLFVWILGQMRLNGSRMIWLGNWELTSREFSLCL